MTEILIIQGHPDASERHLCHAMAEAYRSGAEASGHRVTVIDIAQQDVPFLRSRAQWEGSDLPPMCATAQSAILAAGHLVFVYPLWMGDVPALLKAWIEQVLRQGFAFRMGRHGWRPALRGRSARVIVTMGMPGVVYRWFFFAHSLRSLDRNILKFCGIRPVRWSILGNAEDPGGQAQARFLAKVRRLGMHAR